MNFYTYTIRFVDGYYYHGMAKYRGVEPINDGYFGSPITNKEKWIITMYWKEITGLFATAEEASASEQDNIRPVYNSDPYCLNANCNGVISTEQRRLGAMLGGKTSGERSRRNKTGICDPLNQEKGRKTAKERGTGFYDADFQQSDKMKKLRKDNGKKSGNLAVENGQLAAARANIDPEKRREACRQTANLLKEEGRGLGSIPYEERSQRSKDTMAKTNASQWVDPDHPEIGAHNPGNLARIQRKFGYPSSKENRVKLG